MLPKSGDYVVVTKSMKDVMVFYVLGGFVTIVTLMFVGILYLIIVYSITLLIKLIEKRLRASDKR